MCPCLKIGKLALLGLAPVAVVAVLATQFLAPAGSSAAPAAPEGVLLSDLREPAGKQPAPPAAGTAGEQLVVDMNNWTETDGSGRRR